MICILDKSGSMYGKESDTIGSFNQMLKEQKDQPGEAYITTALFSDCCRPLPAYTCTKGGRADGSHLFYRRKHCSLWRHRRGDQRSWSGHFRNREQFSAKDSCIYHHRWDGKRQQTLWSTYDPETDPGKTVQWLGISLLRDRYGNPGAGAKRWDQKEKYASIHQRFQRYPHRIPDGGATFFTDAPPDKINQKQIFQTCCYNIIINKTTWYGAVEGQKISWLNFKFYFRLQKKAYGRH